MQSVSGHMSDDLELSQRNGTVSATKWKILAAAEEVMSQKGFASSSISEIARKANVTDSVIYQYFKGKQDLLFSVPGEKLKNQLALLKEHLAGIPDVQSQLQKVMWLQLRYHDATAPMLGCSLWNAGPSKRSIPVLHMRSFANIPA